ncbi:hypothetical protein [Allomuricauda sp. SCSIO 65647]|uniref:hypothetical protein n=1 Tax=Allomuricauda sp. SCSIO 65647 TaxID=2908843 RepID=UPI001F2868C7|nr:hypothetical protein [Muricauda sp. SCSIO 65647]UJH68826.1 hypothetical protein L0P89_06315 [Muricauda sp. SCSIO 65647]
MTKSRKKHWFWNLLIVLTIIFCMAAFVIHYKNYSSIEEGKFKIYSGIYRQQLPLSEMDSISFVKRIPEMERHNGFSWLAREKGVFKDSLTESRVYVFVDDLRQQKIRIVHHDSLKLFLNFTDSLETAELYETLKLAIDPEE